MTDRLESPDRLAELLVHLGRAAQSEHPTSALTAAQWACLRFFSRANERTRTPSAFADFQATTRGTASQIIKSLERRRLVEPTRSNHDRRKVRYDLTPNGRAMLEQDPLNELIAVIGDLDDADRDQFRSTLSRIAAALSEKRNATSFGTCLDCSHFEMSRDPAFCTCMAAELAAEDIAKLCASYTPALEAASEGEPDGTA